MSIRTILAPGIQWTEIDKSQYSPSMTGSNCFIMGITNKGEPYQPMEFTSRSAWQNYYGSPRNEAERYAYAAATEVLNQNGRLYFARLPYDNPSFEQVVGFKYKLNMDKELSAEFDDNGMPTETEGHLNATPFWEIYKADKTINNVAAIEPAKAACLYDLSAIDEFRTDENKVANNTFMIANIAFNTYDKITEDTRKNEKRELIGIMPVVTTAANALYQQKLIDVDRQNVIGYETIGTIKTLDAAMQLSSKYPELSTHTSNAVRASDMAKLVNTKTYYQFVASIDVRSTTSIAIPSANYTFDSVTGEVEKFDDMAIRERIANELEIDEELRYVKGSWDESYQLSVQTTRDAETKEFTCEGVSALISYKKSFTESQMSSEMPAEYETSYKSKYGWHNPGGDDAVPDTVSQEANAFFPTIDFDGTAFDRTNMKKIGVVVYKMFLDPAEGNKINFEPVEAYAGSLCKTDKDPNTGATTFIDTIINSQSRYINFFSNCFNTKADKQYYEKTLDMFVMQPGAAHQSELSFTIKKVGDIPQAIREIANAANIQLAEMLTVGSIKINADELQKFILDVEHQTDNETLGQIRDTLEELKKHVMKDMVPDTVCPSLGFYSAMTKETISISKTIYDGMNKAFEKVEDLNKLDIDIIPDAGLANIASYLKALFGDKGEYDLQITDDVGNSLLGMWRCDANNQAVKTWKTVLQKFDNFCKNVRKDCMFIADGPRPLVLQGQKKIIRSSKPANTIDANIIPNLKWLTGLNTSYGAMYVDWFEQADDYSGDFFWCPPSIKAMGVYINTDVNFNYWDAPAGLNRGVVAATDVAFSPTIKQAGAFYEKNFNYAIKYPNDGIVLEGQKTLQTKPSAFDRVNVRRLFLRLERASFKTSRWFVYEGNTAYTRQRLVDALDPYFKDAKNNGGIYEYKIKCDEDNNTPETIDNNELHVAIGIKPVKTSEFILLDFVCLRTGGSWSEAGF